MNNNIIDINSLINSKNKSSRNWEKYNFLFKKFSKVLGKKIFEISDFYENILILSSDRGEALENISDDCFKNIFFLSPYRELLEKFYISKKNILKVEGNFETIPFKNGKFDLIISNLYLHNINEKKIHLKNLYNLLNNEGLLICNFFGEKSLFELRSALFETDERIFNGIFMRLAPNLKMINVSDLLTELGFNEIVSEKITYKIYYENVRKIFEDLRGLGENSALINRKKSLMTKNYINTLNKIYKEKFSDLNGLKVSCDVISISGWKNKRR